MPRKNLVRTDLYPYHITIRTNNREWFSIPINEVWEICINALKKANEKHPVNIQAFVLMSNHYHLIIWTPNSNVDKFMFECNRIISAAIRKKTKRINRIFGDRYKWSLVNDSYYHDQVLKYVYRNPLKAKIVDKCESYEYSTLYYQINNLKLPFKLFNPITKDHKNYLSSLNQLLSSKEDKKLQIALTRSVFRIPSKRTLKRLNII